MFLLMGWICVFVVFPVSNEGEPSVDIDFVYADSMLSVVGIQKRSKPPACDLLLLTFNSYIKFILSFIL